MNEFRRILFSRRTLLFLFIAILLGTIFFLYDCNSDKAITITGEALSEYIDSYPKFLASVRDNADNYNTLAVLQSGFSAENIRKTGAFTVSFATSKTVVPCDYVGIVSANDVPDKFERAGFHALKSEYVNAPLIEELPVAVECKLLKFNEDGICIGEIVNVSADESVLGENGRIDASLLDPISYDGVTHTYRNTGRIVGQAFSDGKKIK